MSSDDLVAIINASVLVLTILIFARVIMSWVPQLIDPRGPIGEFLITTTEPLLAPIRAIMPRTGMIDFTPMIALILLQVLVRPLLIALVS
jgi:YggT family protein